MIPFLTSTWLRLAAALGVLVLISLCVWRLIAWHGAYTELPAVQAALVDEQECNEGSRCAQRVAALKAVEKAISEGVVRDYENELQALRDRPAAPPVRLCRPASRNSVRLPDAAGPADGATAGGELPFEASGDIGQRLFDLADEADREALKLRYLQDYDRALSAVK